MPVGLGLASSHAPSMFLEPEQWFDFYPNLIQGLPQPPPAQAEDLEVVRGYVTRIQRDFNILRERLAAYRPDAVVIIGDDQHEVFSDALSPTLAIFTGSEVAGTRNLAAIGQPISENHVRFACASDLSQYLLDGLVKRDFDVAWGSRLVAMGHPQGGLGHAFTRPGAALGMVDMAIPMIPVFLNAYHPPLMSARRCLHLGRAIVEIFRDRPERVAIYGSGGLSHDPRGPRAGWIDEPLDRWLLDQLARGHTEALSSLFTVDSDSFRSGTGEIRSWLAVAGAFSGVPAQVVDYFPAYHAVTGVGFAWWDSAEGNRSHLS